MAPPSGLQTQHTASLLIQGKKLLLGKKKFLETFEKPKLEAMFAGGAAASSKALQCLQAQGQDVGAESDRETDLTQGETASSLVLSAQGQKAVTQQQRGGGNVGC